jgi:inosose dehydratase
MGFGLTTARRPPAWAAADWAMAEAVAAGLTGWEPILGSAREAHLHAGLARQHGLEMPTFYMGGALHAPEAARATLAVMRDTAQAAAQAGGRRAVVNPNPIAWGQALDKTDDQLRFQAGCLTDLATSLADLGVTLCYHTHDAEMRAAAREFHHMLLATDPDLVRLCLDPHWIWRGAGNSALALMDIISLYGARTEVIHIRQSQGGVWAQAVGAGDLDYAAIVAALVARGAHPQLVIENATEAGTPDDLSPQAAHRQSLYFVQRVFAPLLSPSLQP